MSYINNIDIKRVGTINLIALLGLILVFSLVPSTQVNANVTPVSVAITVSPSTICSGQSAHLTWSSTDATSISINQGIGSVLPYGDRYVSPTQTTTYTITGTNSTGGYGTASATVIVNNCTPIPTPIPPVLPVAVAITISPTTICSGQSTHLTWSSTDATSISINQGIGSVLPYGDRYVSPTQTTTYTITGTNSTGGYGTASATVIVNNCTPIPTPIPTPVPTPIPTPAPIPQPTILSLTANPASICRGDSSILSWETSYATRVTLSGFGDVALDGSKLVSPAYIHTYRLTAYNSEGDSIFRDTNVDVMDCNPTPSPTPTPIPTPIPTPTPIPLPQILSLTANPASICRGDSSLLSWETSNATRVVLSGVGDVALDGSRLVSPTYIHTYRLTAYNSEGASVFRDTNVDVNDCDTSCDINANISVSPSYIHQGESATVHWDTSNASQAVINQFGSVSLNGSRTVSPSYTTTYTINADDNDSNCSDSASATLTVTTENNDIYPTLDVDKLVRNVTNYSGSESNSVNANPGDTVEFVIRVYVGEWNNNGGWNNNYANNIRVYDMLPSGLSYITGSTTVDGNYTSDGIVGGGLYLGSRSQGNTAVIRFRATVNSGYYNYNYNYNYSTTLTNTANATADNVSSVNDTASVYVNGSNNNQQSGNMVIEKFVRNISRGQNDNRTSTNASYNETVEFDLRIRNTSSITLYNVIVSDNLPAGLTYSDRTTSLNNSIISNGITGGGVNIGTLSPGQETWVKFYATVNTSSQMTITNTGSVRADNFGMISSSPVTIYLGSGVVAGAINVKTGASSALFISLFGAMLITLGYYIYKRRTALVA